MSHAPCELCERVTRRRNRHHLIPRTCHGNKWFRKRFTRAHLSVTVALCSDCHGAIHRFVPSEKELGRDYNTLELVRTIPGMDRFLAWIRKQK